MPTRTKKSHPVPFSPGRITFSTYPLTRYGQTGDSTYTRAGQAKHGATPKCEFLRPANAIASTAARCHLKAKNSFWPIQR